MQHEGYELVFRSKPAAVVKEGSIIQAVAMNPMMTTGDSLSYDNVFYPRRINRERLKVYVFLIRPATKQTGPAKQSLKRNTVPYTS